MIDEIYEGGRIGVGRWIMIYELTCISSRYVPILNLGLHDTSLHRGQR